jgi:membrane protease subunit HflK
MTTTTERSGVPPSVRIIRASVAWARRKPGRAAIAVLAVFLLVSIASGIYMIGTGETAALQRCGRLIDAAVQPGLGLRLPWGFDHVTRVRTGEVRRSEVTGDSSKALQLITGDENIIEMQVVAQYTISDLGAFLYRTDDAPGLVAQAVRAALVQTVGTMAVDDVLTSGKAAIQQDVRRQAQRGLDRYGAGLTLVGINIQGVTPPVEAANAFRDVNDAKADAATSVNVAQSGRERALSLARGEASQLTQEASGRAAARVQQARGSAERFAALLVQRRLSPEQTTSDLYLHTAQKILPRAKLVLLAPHQAPRIDLNMVERSQP